MIKRNEIEFELVHTNGNDPASAAFWISGEDVLSVIPDSDYREEFSDEEIDAAIQKVLQRRIEGN